MNELSSFIKRPAFYFFSGVLSLCVCVCVCCHSWPELNHSRDYGDLSLYLPWEKGDLIGVSAWDGCSLGFSFRPSHILWKLTGPDMSHTRIYTHPHSQAGDTLFIKCVSCDLIPPQENTHTHTHTHKYPPTQTHRVAGEATCVYNGQDGAVCFTWLMIAQAVIAAERLCWGGLAACRVGLGLLSGLGSASA